jgi:predicted esterase
MKTRRPPRKVLIAGILSMAVGGCGNSSRDNGGSGGIASPSGGNRASTAAGGGIAGGEGSGGTVGTGGNAAGGTSATGGATGQGGSTGVAGSAGRSGQTGGTSEGGSQSITGGRTGTGGQAGQAAGGSGSGGSGQAGGMPGVGGQMSMGGQPSQGMGGQPSGGRAGQGAGGSTGVGGSTGTCGQLASAQRSISFGTLLDAQAVMCQAQQLAKSLSNPSSSQWRAKGDQHRKYRFADANADEPYRLYVPTNWDGKSDLPLAMFLHGSGSDENSYVDMNNKQLLNLAQEHGYVLVAPLGDKGAYGNFLRLSAPFGQPDEAAKLMAQVTTDSERSNELSERDVINVLEQVLAEYPIDRASMFLLGHSMGSGGTWYIGGKYASYWKGLAPMSGPFVQETGYPWDDLHKIAIFVTEGTQAPSLDGSRVLRDWLKTNGFNAQYEEVNADHGGMIPLVLPDIFTFFDRSRAN